MTTLLRSRSSASNALSFGILLLAVGGIVLGSTHAQEPDSDSDRYVIRTPPPALEDFEKDDNKDGIPDGWYNARDVKVVTEGGVVGPHFLRFECSKPGRPARLSRAFGVDGKKFEAILIGLWIRLDQVQTGERIGEDPGLMIDFLGERLRQASRGTMGPWTSKSIGSSSSWTKLSKRIPIPPGTKDAIMSIGLLGATGVLDVDGFTFDLIPVGGSATTNIVPNPGFELGDPVPNGWLLEKGGHRISSGYRSHSSLELARGGSLAMTVLSLPIDRFSALDFSAVVRGNSLRGSGGAVGRVFFLDAFGKSPDAASEVRAFSWSGSFDWQKYRVTVPVPRGVERAVLQFEKLGDIGSVKIDDIVVTASPDAESSSWNPYHIEEDVASWIPIKGSTGVAPLSALDFSFLLSGPAGKSGRVVVKNGRLNFDQGGRARFFGVQILPPYAYMGAAKASALADRLSRLGVNLVRLGDLDSPLGPDRSLFDDTRDDTKAFDPIALGRLDELIAALKQRGIYVAMELQSNRRFRVDDGVRMPGALPPGGGPSAIFDPTLTRLAQTSAREFLARENPRTSLTYRSDPAVAWVTMAGEISLFDMNDPATDLPGDYSKEYHELAAKSTLRAGGRFKQGLDTSHWTGLAAILRKDGLKAPLASVSHWRREQEFAESLAGPGLDLVDDRIYWIAPPWISPRYRSMLWSQNGGLISDANKKRSKGKPYVLGQYCDFTQGLWSSPFEGAEQLLAAATAVSEDWDGLVRRGVFMYPVEWGASAPGTEGGEDIFQLPAIANAAPHVFGLWPHVSSLLLRGHDEAGAEKVKEKVKARGASKNRKPGQAVPGWDPTHGRLVIETPYTQGIAGATNEDAVSFDRLTFDVESPFATVIASSAGKEPIETSSRLLLTAIARITPTGFKWSDEWRRETADPGRPPLLAEPVLGRVTWKHEGKLAAYALDNNGVRLGPAKTEKAEGGISILLNGVTHSMHYELVVE